MLDYVLYIIMFVVLKIDIISNGFFGNVIFVNIELFLDDGINFVMNYNF